MARFVIKTLAVAALVCLVVDLVASDTGKQYQQPQELPQPQEPYKEPAAAAAVTEPAYNVPTTAAPSSFKDKLKGFVSSVKEGAADAYESVSESVSDAAHTLEEKRKEAVAGTKKLVNGAIDKIKTKYDSLKGNDETEAAAKPTASAAEVPYAEDIDRRSSDVDAKKF